LRQPADVEEIRSATMRQTQAAALLAPFASLVLMAATAPPQPARPVDLQHYTGKWYEVARLHNKIEEDCANAQADYIPQPDGGFKVTETCTHPNGSQKLYHATMKVLDQNTNAKFRLTFFPFVWKDYWVLDYAPDNSWVVLGEPTGRYLWLFSRTPNLQTHKAALVAKAKALGYDASKLIYDKGAG
jgi:apolipoprotein D and lipocalin family protein